MSQPSPFHADAPLTPAATRQRTIGAVVLLGTLVIAASFAHALAPLADPSTPAEGAAQSVTPNSPSSVPASVLDLAHSTAPRRPAPSAQPVPAPPRSTPTSQMAAAHHACSPEALAVGIWHHPYAEASAADLVSVGGRHQLHHEAASALRTLIAAARRDGVTLTVGSAFRSVAYQSGIVQRKKARGMLAREMYHYSAPAGYSEHHTGFVVDFAPIDNRFATSAAFRWLQQHAGQYGWQQSFTAQSTAADGMYRGIATESWHWRYVGSPAARAALAVVPCGR